MTALYHPRPERWPQFGLRGLFVLVTLLGVACWLGVQVKWIKDRHEALRGLAHAPYESATADWSTAKRLGPLLEPAVHEPDDMVPWSLRILGEHGMRQILIVNGQESQLKQLRVLFPETYDRRGVLLIYPYKPKWVDKP